MPDTSFQTDGTDQTFIRGKMLIKILGKSHEGFERGVIVQVSIPVECHIVDTVAGLFQHQLGPFHPFRFNADMVGERIIFPDGDGSRNQFNCRVDPFHHLAEFGDSPGIFLWRFITDLPWAVNFIADTPIFNLVRCVKTVVTA